MQVMKDRNITFLIDEELKDISWRWKEDMIAEKKRLPKRFIILVSREVYKMILNDKIPEDLIKEIREVYDEDTH